MTVWLPISLPPEHLIEWESVLDRLGLPAYDPNTTGDPPEHSYWPSGARDRVDEMELSRFGLLLLGESPVVAFARQWEASGGDGVEKAVDSFVESLSLPPHRGNLLPRERVLSLPLTMDTSSDNCSKRVSSSLRALGLASDPGNLRDLFPRGFTDLPRPSIAAHAQASLALVSDPRLACLAGAHPADGAALPERSRELAKLCSAAKDAEEENELLLLQLHQVQEELEHHFLENQRLQQSQNREEGIREELRRVEALLSNS